MDGTPDGSRPDSQPYSPSTIPDVQNSSTVISSDQSIELSSPRREQYATPPASTAEAVSPASSRNRGQLRAASFGIGSSGGQGSLNPYRSFGAGVRNVPPPILTKNPGQPIVTVTQNQMRKPFPKKALQSAGGMLCGSAGTSELQQESFPTHLSNEMSQIAPGPLYSDHSKGEELLGQRLTGHSMHDRAVCAADLYAERADEIGPCHHVPGISHLGGLLTPAGWKQGDEAIDPQAAQRLFQAAREEAKTSLITNFDDMEHLGQENRIADRDRKWKERYQLDHTLYEERVNVYHRYQKRRQSGPRAGYDLNPPQPVNPPATTSYGMSANPPPYSLTPNLHREPTRVYASHPAQSQPVADRSFPTPSLGIISPSLLDPTLVPQTLEVVHRKYQERRAEIQRMNEENELTLELWIRSYAPHISKTQFSPGIPPPSANQPARPFYGRSNGNSSLVSDDQGATSVPRPPQYVSPTRGRFDGRGNCFQYQTAPPSMEPPKLRYRPAVPELSMPLEPDNNETDGRDRQSRAQENRIERRNDARTSTGETKRMKQNSLRQKRKRAPKEKAEKIKTWYHDDMENSNLPTTAISAEALQAGLDYNVNGTQTETSEKSSPAKRRRGGKLEFDPSMGIPLTAMAADLLIARGVPDHRDVPVQVSSGATQFSFSSFDGVPPVANGLSALSTLYSPSPAQQNNFRFFRNGLPEASPEREVSSEILDDHQDGDYGRNTARRTSSTPRKATVTRTAPRCRNKRKSDDAPIANQRSRLNTDGTNDRSDAYAYYDIHGRGA
ncbi:hypothetical protein MMC29_007036 [Sticta canariensis]|nr:hypothetical protein [Sticta canariensis]